MLCKHFETSKGCAFKEKCQFAHGYAELRTPAGYVSIRENIIFDFFIDWTPTDSSEVSTPAAGPRWREERPQPAELQNSQV
jgi:hypothetical protein